MRQVKSKDGTEIAFDTFGSGPPLIYITGAICHRLFKPVVNDAKHFAHTFTVFIYDRRGRGDSGNTKPYSIERELEDLEALIDAAGGMAFIYGHSSGAVLALEAALKFPEKIKKAILYEAPYAPNEAEQAKNYAFYTQTEQLLAKSYGGAIRLFLNDIGMPKPFIYLMALMPGWKKIKALAPTLLHDFTLTRDMPPLERATDLQVPILLLFGEKSTYDFAKTGNQLGAVSSKIEVKVVEGADHMVSPKILLPIFQNFFRE